MSLTVCATLYSPNTLPMCTLFHGQTFRIYITWQPPFEIVSSMHIGVHRVALRYAYPKWMKFLARTNYLPLNERFFKINLRESSKCNICDDDIVEDLHHFLFECKTLRGIRQTRTIRRNWNSNKMVLSGSCVFRVTILSKAAVLDRRLLS